jgi:hypothetical protein
MAMLVIRLFGPLLLVQYHIYRMRQISMGPGSLGRMKMPQEKRIDLAFVAVNGTDVCDIPIICVTPVNYTVRFSSPCLAHRLPCP